MSAPPVKLPRNSGSAALLAAPLFVSFGTVFTGFRLVGAAVGSKSGSVTKLPAACADADIANAAAIRVMRRILPIVVSS
jgi:hypothetical protein